MTQENLALEEDQVAERMRLFREESEEIRRLQEDLSARLTTLRKLGQDVSKLERQIADNGLPEHFMLKPIREVDLPNAIRYALIRSGVRMAGELVEIARRGELLQLGGIGKKSATATLEMIRRETGHDYREINGV